MNIFQKEVAGRLLTIEAGQLAEQARGAVTINYGETVVLVTVCASPEPREGVDFLPLTVDYEERLYAAGKIPGGFFRREGRPSQEAVLVMRLTDRPLRPLFPKGFRNDTQVVITVLSADQENDPDILAIIGASTALGVSDIPFEVPVSAVRVGRIQGQLVLNPTFSQLIESDLDLLVVGTKESVVMVEAGAKEVPEEVMLEAVKFGQEANQELIPLQEELIARCGRPKKEFEPHLPPPELEEALSPILEERLASGVYWRDRGEREELLSSLKKELLERFDDSFPAPQILSVFESKLKEVVRGNILKKGLRPDGRGLSDIRPVSCAVGTLPRTHGSGLFTRGGTQVLTIATLGSAREEQTLDGLSPEESKRFIHHYNFPPFSVGEVRRLGSPGRREIGHGALAEKALLPVIPSEQDFPYTIRLVSEVLSSNGSTSMASVCGSSLSLMDAGVPIKAHVAGVAMGLVAEDGNHAILSDIEGMEDALGDMDLKVAGTAAGVTALQMDIKLKGIGYDILEKALSQARQGRLFILEKMSETIAASRPELSKYAPRMTKIMINPDKIRHVIGPGGRTIRSIMDETKVTIDVENDGSVIIGSPSEEATQRAIKIIEDLTREVEVGGLYTGRVTRVTNFGAFVEILPGKEGLVPLSELAEYRARSVEDVVKVGDEIMVIVTEIDRLGRVNLSRRAVYQKLSSVPGARVGERRPPMQATRRGGEGEGEGRGGRPFHRRRPPPKRPFTKGEAPRR